MRIFFLIFSSYISQLLSFSQENETVGDTNAAVSDLLDTSFFGDVLENVRGEQDAMGTQPGHRYGRRHI